jgi:hypothetical protein
MTESTESRGNRRIDEVLGPRFAEGLGELEDAEVRRRRDQSRAEVEYLSLLRRLVQGRTEILRAERDRRQTGGPAGSVVDRLPDILSEGTRGPSRGEAMMLQVSTDEIAMARRRVERLVSDAHLSNLEALSDEELDHALELLDREERALSDTRTEVIAIHDALQGEMKGRLRAELGPTS